MSENEALDTSAMTPREHIRNRPYLYFGSTDRRTLHLLITYVLEVSIDAALNKECSHIEVILQPNQTVTIADDSPGLPVEIYEHLGASLLELQMAWHLPGLARNFETSTVNAVCAEFMAQVKRDGFLWQQTYSEGEPTSAVTQIRPLEPNESTGTTITFRPDFSILEPDEFSYTALANRLRELAYLVPGLTLTLKDMREQPEGGEVSFCYPNGLVDFVTFINRETTPVHQLIHTRRDFEATTRYGNAYTIGVEIALQYVEQPSNIVLSYVNRRETLEGGTHLGGLLQVLQDFISEHMEREILTDVHRDGVDIPFLVQGLTAIIHILHPHPAIESQQISKLINPDVGDAVSAIASQAMHEFTEQHPAEMQRLVDHFLARKQERDRRRFGA